MQYDVYVNPSPATRDVYPYVVDVQNDLLSNFQTRLVIPLRLHESDLDDLPNRMSPVFVIKGIKVFLTPFLAAAIHKNNLKKSVANLRSQAHEITSAIDSVISGV
jgi:toxin CcdB